MIRKNTLVLSCIGVVSCLLVGCGGSSDSNSNDGGSSDSSDVGNSRIRQMGLFAAGADNADINKMKKLALTAHNLHDTVKQFPFAPISGRPRNEKLSWRIDLLPFLDLDSEYQKFDTKSAWDSAKNKPLVSSSAGQEFVLSNGNLVSAIKFDQPPKTFGSIIDGSSNTVMLIENPDAGIEAWTQPPTMSPADATKLVKSLKMGEYLLVTFFDGSTQRLYSTEGKGFSDQDIQSVFEYRDGHVFDIGQLMQPIK